MARTNAYSTALNGTPQTERLPGRPDQVENKAGGYVFKISPAKRLERFLILGSEGGTFYATERAHTAQNIDALVSIFTSDEAVEAVKALKDVSTGGMAPKNTPAIFALAVAIKHGDDATRDAAYAAVPKVCRTGTHLFELAGFLKDVGKGWSRGLRSAFNLAMLGKGPDHLALHAVKYRQRYGWTNRDLLRLTHPNINEFTFDEGERAAYRAVFDFMCKKPVDLDDPNVPAVLRAHLQANSDTATPDGVATLIRSARLPWESIPDPLRAESVVTTALIENMPVIATTRQLAANTRNGTLKATGTPMTKVVTDRLKNPEAITKSRAHPMQFLEASRTYASGGGLGRSQGDTYTPVARITSALDKAFELAFGNVTAADKRTYIGLDVSGSMGSLVGGSSVLTCRDAAAALSLVTVKTEPECYVAGFTGGWGNRGRSSSIQALPFNEITTLTEAIDRTSGLPFGPTDCSLPMIDAEQQKMDIDTFIIITDNETWGGRMHPVEALRKYRSKRVRDARLIVVAMTATPFSIADPNDPGMMDVVGFSTATPNVMSAFSRREF